ncbi:MAG: hypothetical protein AAB389_04460 [Patescibacteria group bacterium]
MKKLLEIRIQHAGGLPMNDFANDILTLVKVFTAAILGFFLMATWFGISHWNTVLFAILLMINITLSTLMAVMVMIMVIALGEWIWLKIKQFFYLLLKIFNS